MAQIRVNLLPYKLLLNIRISSVLHLITKSFPQMKASPTSMSTNQKIQLSPKKDKNSHCKLYSSGIQRSSLPHRGPMKTTVIRFLQ